MTKQELEYIVDWYAEQKLANKVIHSTFTNSEGVLVHGKIITYPATAEEWIKNDCVTVIHDNYLQPVAK